MDRKIYFLICLLLLLFSFLFSDIKFSSSSQAGILQNATLNINGSFLNYGNFIGDNGSLRFYGDGTSNVYGRFNINLKSLTINKSSGLLTLYSYFYIEDQLNLVQGEVDAYNARTSKIHLNYNKRKNSLKTLSQSKSRIVRSSDFLTLMNDATINRYYGSLDFTPNLQGEINLSYYRASTTGNEVPSDQTKIQKFKVDIPSGSITLSQDIKINELLQIENGNLDTNSHTITMGKEAPIEADPSDITGTIQGEAISVGTNSYSNSALGFLISQGNDIGTFRALLYKSAAQVGNHKGISKQWMFESTNPPSNRDITFYWDQSEDNHETLPDLQIYNKPYKTSPWYAVSAPTNPPSSNPRQMILHSPSTFDYYTISDAIINTNTDSLNFPETYVNFSSTMQFTVTNYQSTSFNTTIYFPSYLNIYQTTRKGTKHIKPKPRKETKSDVKAQDRESYTFSLSGNSTMTFTAEFNPTTAGIYSGSVLVRVHSNNYPTKKISVYGIAKIPPTIAYNPSSISDTLSTDTSSQTTLTLSNSGDDSLSYSASVDYSRNSQRMVATIYPYNENYATGTCTSTAKTQTSLVEAHYHTAGWMKFDISSLPTDAMIDSVYFNGFVNDTNYPWWSITPVSNDPITTDAATLNSDILNEADSGYYLRQNENSNYSTGWKQHKLSGTINSDLQNSISNSWFAIGIASRDNSETYFIKFDGWNETNKPYLTVYYHTNTLNWLSLNNSSSIAGNIESSAQENINVLLDATNLSDGIYSANIKINSNDPNNSDVTIPVTLTVSTPQISVNPATLDFEEVIIGNSSIKTFTISNSGSAVLSGTINTPSDFTVTENTKELLLSNTSVSKENSFHTRASLGFSIAAGSSKSYMVEFTPTQERDYMDYITISNNSPNSSVNIEVVGTAVAVNMTLSNNSYEKTLSLNNTTTDQLIISTTGNGTLNYTAIVNYPTSLVRSTIDVYPFNTSNATGTCTDSLITENSLVRGKLNEAGWFKFDLSTIPEGSRIFRVTFHGYVNNTHYPWWSLTPLSNDPQNTDVNTLYNDIIAEANSGYYLKSDENSSYTTGWKEYTLEGNISSDIQNALTQDWFAMGMVSRDNNSSFYIVFDGWNETNKPYLTIEYAPIDKQWILIDNQLSVQGSVTQSHPDTLELSFNSANLATGDYTASIDITSNDPAYSSESLPVTLHVIQTLNTPQNVEIAVNNGYITLSWDDNGATSYKVYASDTPNGTFSDVTSNGSFVTNRSRITWRISASSQGVKKFYKITASNEPTLRMGKK